MELQKAGVNFDSVDLKQTLLNAVSPYKVIHDKAVQIATSSANVLLIAHSCVTRPAGPHFIMRLT